MLRIQNTPVCKSDFRNNHFYQCFMRYMSTLKTHTHTRISLHKKACVIHAIVAPFDSVDSYRGDWLECGGPVSAQ